jgi:hypothetical protein
LIGSEWEVDKKEKGGDKERKESRLREMEKGLVIDRGIDRQTDTQIDRLTDRLKERQIHR